MKRKGKLIFFFLFAFLIFSPFFIQAQPLGITNPITYNSFSELFTAIANAISLLIAGLGTVMVIIAGILFLVSAGNPKFYELAKSALLYAALGLMVGLGAGSIIEFASGVAGKAETPAQVIANLTTRLGEIIASLGVVMMIVSGIYYLISFGNPEKMTLARKSLIYAITGIAVGLLATAMVELIKGVAGP